MEHDGSLPQWYVQISQYCAMCGVSCEIGSTANIRDESASFDSTLGLLTAEETADPADWQHKLKPSYLPNNPNRLIRFLVALSESLERRGMKDWATWTQKMPF